MRQIRIQISSFFPAGPILACLIFVLAASANGSPTAGVRVERRAYLMGTTCTIVIVAPDRSTGLAAAEAAFAEIARSEDRLSTWRDDTVLARLNRFPVGKPFSLDARMFDLFVRLRELRDSSGGGFDPASGRLLEAWDVRGAGRVPTRDERAAALAGGGMNLLRLDAAASTVTRLAPGVLLDAGAFGKGEALARAAEELRDRGLSRFSIDFGGQVSVGSDTTGEGIAIADPRQRDRPVGRFRLNGLSAATSTQSERPGHILDPRTGQRAAAFGSVTAVSPDPLVADAMSTAMFVLGPEAGLQLAEERPDLEALFLMQTPAGLRARMTPGMRELIVTLDIPFLSTKNHKESR